MINLNHPHQVNEKNHLTIAGVDTVDIAKEYGTPLKLNYLPSIGNQIKKASS